MELWWWFVPSFLSSFLWMIIFSIISLIVYKLGFFKVSNWFLLIAAVPMLLEIIFIIGFIIGQTFKAIWSPHI